MADTPNTVNLTVDGRKITAPAGSLLIEACKSVGIEGASYAAPDAHAQGVLLAARGDG